MFRHLIIFSTVLSFIGPCCAQDGLPADDYNPRKKVVPAKDVPPVTEWREADTEGKVKSRTETALLAGPDALEDLGRKLLTEESRDGDGRYTMPYFYNMIGGEGGKIRGENRQAYQSRIVNEWRKKHPGSLVAMVAEARMCNARMYQAIREDAGTPSVEKHYEMVEGICRESLSLLEQAKELQQKDPGWHVTRLVTIRMMDNNRAAFEAAVDDLLAIFPESGYALSRAVMQIQMAREGRVRVWDGWLRGKLAKLPPDVAAKAYVRTINELGLSGGTSEALWGVIVDREMIHRGLDALAKEYPQSIGIAAEEAMLAAFALYEPVRVRSALRRAGGKIDQMVIGKSYYDSVIFQMTQIPWEPKRVGLPDIAGYTFGEVEGFQERMKKAVQEGPRGLEVLIQQLRSNEIQDKDGRYLSCAFFQWFDTDVNHLSDLREVMAKEKLLAEWGKEFPASPFANLAGAYHWIGRAWNSRGGTYAASVREIQWDGFRDGLKKAAGCLRKSEELRENEPAWMVAAMKLLLGTEGGGLDSEGYEQVTEPMFGNFPESMECLAAVIHAAKPRWGGESGEWEPFLREKLAKLPEDVRARAYALAVISIEGYAFHYSTRRLETYGEIKPDKALVKKGLASLAKKYPDSQLLANAEALIFSDLSEEPERAYAAMKRMNGTLDLRIWTDYHVYHRCVRWVAAKKLPK